MDILIILIQRFCNSAVHPLSSLGLLLGTDWHTELLPFFVRKPTLTVFVRADHAIEVVWERKPVVALPQAKYMRTELVLVATDSCIINVPQSVCGVGSAPHHPQQATRSHLTNGNDCA